MIVEVMKINKVKEKRILRQQMFAILDTQAGVILHNNILTDSDLRILIAS